MKKGDTFSGDLDDATDDNSGDKVNVFRDTLVKFLCKSGKLETMEFYRVLWLFNKYYKKWFPSLDDTFLSGENGVGNKNPTCVGKDGGEERKYH